MTPSSQHASRDQLERLLGDCLNALEQAGLEAHLDACEVCRAELEAQAAAPHEWRAVKEFLSDAEGLGSAAAGQGEHVAESISIVLAGLGPTDDPHMLGRLGPYEIAGVVGAGGMGVVLKGYDPALDRYVAIKVLAPHLAVSAAARRRFAREAKAAAAVVHENVVAIHVVAESHDPPYFVMPYVRGVSLEKRLRDEGPLGLAEVLRIGRQIAAGLAAAHAQGLVHRDIKPANILLSEGTERLQLTDFGLARAADDASLTRSGMIAGTPQYMSPEQARGEAVDMRSDQFSLGSVMYAMCSGHPPFRAETSYGIMQRINEDQPRAVHEFNSSMPAWLNRVIGRLLAKEPADRFDSAQQVAELLEQCLAHVQQPAFAPLPAECRRKFRVRWPRAVAVIAAACLAIVAGIAAWKHLVVPSGSAEVTKPIVGEVATPASPPDLWYDGIDQQIQAITGEIDALDQAVKVHETPTVVSPNQGP